MNVTRTCRFSRQVETGSRLDFTNENMKRHKITHLLQLKWVLPGFTCVPHAFRLRELICNPRFFSLGSLGSDPGSVRGRTTRHSQARGRTHRRSVVAS